MTEIKLNKTILMEVYGWLRAPKLPDKNHIIDILTLNSKHVIRHLFLNRWQITCFVLFLFLYFYDVLRSVNTDKTSYFSCWLEHAGCTCSSQLSVGYIFCAAFKRNLTEGDVSSCEVLHQSDFGGAEFFDVCLMLRAVMCF